MTSPRIARGIAAAAILLAAAYAFAGNGSQLTFSPPALDQAPQHIRDAVMKGHDIFKNTKQEVPDHVGNALTCSNCHFDAGLSENALNMVGVTAVFPKYNPMAKRVITVVEQTNLCFMNMLNGKALDAESDDMNALVAYYQWISKGVPIYADVPWLGLASLEISAQPDTAKGHQLVENVCSNCHGSQGLGSAAGPPLWGDQSWAAAGTMSKTDKLAEFIHRFMPRGNPDLTEDQALNAAGYLEAQPRPEPKMLKMPTD